jgi:outer membrane biosynthesis protein TonB
VTTRLGTIAALLAIALPIALFAQNTFGTISGTIVDQSGAVLPGVEVSATDSDRPALRQVVTDGAGRFEIIGVPQGNHRLQARLPGFETFTQQLTLSGEDVQRNIMLSVGSLQETISVTKGSNNAPFPAQGPYKARPANCGPAGVRTSAPPPREGAVRVGGQIRAPAKLYHVAPVYPDGAPAGVVIMQAVIGADGYVTETNVLRDPSAALTQSAIDAVKQWVFEPTLLNCVAVPVRMTVTVQFG